MMMRALRVREETASRPAVTRAMDTRYFNSERKIRNAPWVVPDFCFPDFSMRLHTWEITISTREDFDRDAAAAVVSYLKKKCRHGFVVLEYSHK